MLSFIAINQLGYAPNSPKWALVPALAENHFFITNEYGEQVLQGEASGSCASALCGFAVRRVDFSELCAMGCYTLHYGDLSRKFCIAELPYAGVATALLKGFYYQRASLELLPQFAGVWARPLGHPDTDVLVHASAASAERPEGSVIASPGGWYDAGDYNKYIVNSGITTSTLLAIYADYPQWAENHSVNIPETGGALPDLLAEARWNLDWMLTMQDPHDGGVYHKLTNLHFDGMVLPHECQEPRYVVQKTTAAALDFAATLAQAFQVYHKFDSTFAALCLAAAQRAYAWACRHPEVYYRQPEDVSTGHYGDACVEDEFYWAEMALYTATREPRWLAAARARTPRFGIPSWQSVGTLGLMELLRHEPCAEPERTMFLAEADSLLAIGEHEALGISMRPQDYEWGSNAVVANQGVMLLCAHRRTNDARYLVAAQRLWDYLLGCNPTGYCFVSGFGEKSPLDLHHRPSQGDAVAAPVPGFLVGGPNPDQQDAAKCPPYPSALPALSYLDHVRSCASNEIAINWNAPALYMAVGCSYNPI